MKKIFTFFLIVCLCICTLGVNFNGVGVYAASTNVHHIVTNPSEDCSTAMNIGFLANTGYTGCYVQYTTADDTSWANAKTESGSYKTYGASESTNPFYNKYAKDDAGTNIYQTPTFLDYSVTLSGLTPDTSYIYRIYDGSAYSNTYSFKTAATSGEWSFVVTGDFHEYYANYGAKRAANATKAINAAISLANQKNYPAVEHIVGVGDIVAWGVDYNQWQNVYNQSWIKNYSFANTIGNHDDMDRSGNSSSEYNAIMNNYPLNGYGDEIGTCFYYLYNNVLFIYINYLDTSAKAEAWVDSVISSMAGKYQYSVLVNHRPAMSKYNASTYTYFWPYWADCCDRNNIDLVLAGDHHVYMRSKPIYNGSVLSGYSASKPNATVYIAADSSDGERGVSYSDTSFSETKANNLDSSTLIASNYFRYDYTSSTKDITSLLIHVGKDKLTTNIVYYENSGSASASSDFYEGSVSGHSSFHYGDTSYVYPSDHGYDPGNNEVNPNVPAATKNYLAKASGGTYMYDTTSYPGGASYYATAYYGDNSNQGGSYISGKLNDGVTPADSNPGSSNTDWSVFFNSTGVPELTLQLSQAIYLNNISILYRAETGSYGNASVASLRVSENGSSYTATTAYTTKVSGSGNATLTLQFNSAVKAKYIKFTIPHPSAGTRVAVGEIQVWGDTSLPEGANPNMPSAAKNLAAASNGATYMYPTSIYPGGASYYSQAHYGDNSNQGGTYFAGKLNDGAIPADSNPGSSNVAWATWFSAHGTPEVTFKLSDIAYLNISRLVSGGKAYGYLLGVTGNGRYLCSIVSGVGEVSTVQAYLDSAGNNRTVEAGACNICPVNQRQVVKLTIAAPAADGGSRFAVGEVQIWGDTKLPEGAQVFELVDNSVHTMDDTYLNISTDALNSTDLAAQFKCEVVVLSKTGAAMSASAMVGTGCVVAQKDAAGNTVKSVTVIVLGDTNGDAQLSSSDYLSVQMDINGTSFLNVIGQKAADVSGSGNVDTIDYITMISKLSGLIKSF